MGFVPSYRALAPSGEIRRRAAELEEMLSNCMLCPHRCGVNRLSDERARCHTGRQAVVSAYTPHFGEEPPLVGTNGIGNIFFGNCTLRCAYCQNHEISQRHRDEEAHRVSEERLAEMMLDLQERGCHAIGLVSPTHVVPQIVRALALAADNGLALPLVYNTSAFEELDVLRRLDGLVDIYLPDLKYADNEAAFRYSGARNYVESARAAILEMHRQVGSALVLDGDGLVKRGLIIRHLVLPNDLAGSRESLDWIREKFGTELTVSIMAQYYPAHRAGKTPLLDRSLRASEYDRVVEALSSLSLEQGWAQELDAGTYYQPNFRDRLRPFDHGSKASSDVSSGEGTCNVA
jgi:putative pyruvate formate lyase activating enzyme